MKQEEEGAASCHPLSLGVHATIIPPSHTQTAPPSLLPVITEELGRNSQFQYGSPVLPRRGTIAY